MDFGSILKEKFAGVFSPPASLQQYQEGFATAIGEVIASAVDPLAAMAASLKSRLDVVENRLSNLESRVGSGGHVDVPHSDIPHIDGITHTDAHSDHSDHGDTFGLHEDFSDGFEHTDLDGFHNDYQEDSDHHADFLDHGDVTF